MNLDANLDTIDKFLLYLKNKNIKLWLEDDNLKYHGPQKIITPQILSQLKERRLEIIEFLQKHKADSSSLSIIYPRKKQDCYDLSFGQQRLWFMSELEPDSPVYHITWSVKLTGQLDLDALQKTLNAIVTRHEALRTIFTLIDSKPVQIITENDQVQIPLIDLTDIPSDIQEDEVQNRLQEESRRPFNLSSDLMIRATLFKLQEQEFVLLFVLHHIATDGWSMGIFFREFAILYNAFCQGKPSPLRELPIQYADFALWQKDQWTKGQVMAKQFVYWKKQLRNSPPILPLPVDKPRPEAQTFKGSKYSFEIPQDLTQKLKSICQQEKVSLYMILLGIFQTLLFRYTGQKDIIVGTPIANRRKVEIEKLIGFFVNTLILRTRFDRNPTFRELLRQVRSVTLDAYNNQDLPLEKLVESLQPERYRSASALFQVMFVLQNAPKEEFKLPNLNIKRLNIKNPTAKFDLILFMWENPSGLKSCFEYNTDLFEEATIERLANHFQTIVREITTNLNQSVQELPLLNGEEQKQLLIEWNDTQTDYSRNSSLQELFEMQVAQTPDAVAVICEQEQLTYEQLNQKANQLANYLREIGIQIEAPIGIYLERSLDANVGILGILKVGAAYVPLSASYPQERLNFIVEDSEVSIILTQEKLRETFSTDSSSTKIICLDSQWDAISQHSQDNPKSRVTAHNLAYVIYTSGSTGTPKGVNVLQRGVARLVKDSKYANFNAEQVFLQLAPISFDASTLEIWAPLLNGGKLIICPVEKPSLEELGQILNQNKITTLWLTSAFFNVVRHLQNIIISKI